MDVLSEVLRVMRLSGAVHFLGTFTQPWAFLSSSPDMLPARLEPGAESITQFHVMVSGRCCWGSCGKLPPIELETRDVFVVARGDQHVMTTDLELTPYRSRRSMRSLRETRQLSSDMAEAEKRPDLFAAICIPTSASARSSMQCQHFFASVYATAG
jgi:hypothetical protein